MGDGPAGCGAFGQGEACRRGGGSAFEKLHPLRQDLLIPKRSPLPKIPAKRILQLFGSPACPVIEMQSIDMKNNIIIFTPQEDRQEIRRRNTWIRIEHETVSSLIESFLVFWLGAWSLFAGIEFLQSTGILVF